MKEEENKGKNPIVSPSTKEEFKGYSLDELKYQRALLMLKKEFLREKAAKQVEDVKKKIPVINGESPLTKMSASGIIGRVAKGLNYADYLMLGFSLFSAGKKLVSLFRKKKK